MLAVDRSSTTHDVDVTVDINIYLSHCNRTTRYVQQHYVGEQCACAMTEPCDKNVHSATISISSLVYFSQFEEAYRGNSIFLTRPELFQSARLSREI